ncbi:MAG: hypothetical protein Q4B40_06215 [Clostridia bacterium]|nr:hypothetical protein [Clostridia bacterium]
MDKQKIYIIQMHTKTIPSRFVKLVTRYEYSHVAIALTKDCDEIYSFGRRSAINILNGGFVKEHKNGDFFKRFNNTYCRIYELDVTNEQYLKIKNQLLLMEQNPEKYKYDFIGIFLRAIKLHISFKNKYVCSTFVAYILQQSGAYNFSKEIHHIKPIDFENIIGAKEVYSGEYKSLTTV